MVIRSGKLKEPPTTPYVEPETAEKSVHLRILVYSVDEDIKTSWEQIQV